MTPDQGDTLVGLAGDWHGDLAWAVHALNLLASRGIRTVYHVGDFGLYRDDISKRFLRRLDEVAGELDLTIWVTPGNHEDWDGLDALFATGPGPQRVSRRIWMLPRGHRWTHAGRSFVSLGGAPSVNFDSLIEGVSWWPGEAVTREMAEQVAAAGQAEVMLTHDSPNTCTGRVSRIIAGPSRWSVAAMEYAAAGRANLDVAYESVRPKLLVHGHYHVYDQYELPDGRRIVSLDKNGSTGNVASLDLGADRLHPVRAWLSFGAAAA